MKKILTGALLSAVAFTFIYCSKGGPKDFAKKLSTEVSVLINGGPTKVPAWGEDRIYADPNFQLKLIQETGDMSLKTPGKIEFSSYDSPIGELNGELNWMIDHILPEGASMWSRVPWDRADHYVSGTLKNEDDEPVRVEILFSLKRGDGFPEEPYDIDSIELHGKIKVGDNDPVEF